MSTSINKGLSNDDDEDNCNVKNNWFCEQNKSSALALCFLVRFFDVHCTTTNWEGPNRRDKVWKEQIHFLSDFFTVVVVVFAFKIKSSLILNSC